MSYQPLTQTAHEKLTARLKHGDWAIDATAGNGHDTVFLAEKVGKTGHVYAFDIQAQAIQSTRDNLSASNLLNRVTVCQAGHENMLQTVPPVWRNNVAAITFNLGYLPNSDKVTITQPKTTLAALEQSLSLLKPGGVLAILAYRGHAGGELENAAIVDWLAQKTHQISYQVFASKGPVLYFGSSQSD